MTTRGVCKSDHSALKCDRMCKLLKGLSGVFRKLATIIRTVTRKDSDKFWKNKEVKKPRLEFDDFVDDVSVQCHTTLLLPYSD
mgnify:CR=1 FL=1